MSALRTRLSPALPASIDLVELGTPAAPASTVRRPAAPAPAPTPLPAPRAAFPARTVLRLVESSSRAASDAPRQPAQNTTPRTVSLLILGLPEDIAPLVHHAQRKPDVQLLGIAVPSSHASSSFSHSFVGESGDPCGPSAALFDDRLHALADVPVLGDLSHLERLLDTHKPTAVLACWGGVGDGGIGATQREAIERAVFRRRIAFRSVASPAQTVEEIAQARWQASSSIATPAATSAAVSVTSPAALPARLPAAVATPTRAFAPVAVPATPPSSPFQPQAHQSTSGQELVPRVVDFSRLIGRTPYRADEAAVTGLLTGRRVLVTGAGGSIGSELVRVACQFQPSEVILVERSENALFEIDRQLGSRFPKIARKAVLHDVVDSVGTLRLLEKHKPDVVFHSAAHKHVPLMENHPGHAVTNNLFGTKAIADAALQVGCSHMVMISSDKAVNPTSVMGATKRLAELYIRHLASGRAARHSTRLSMVRFGNVLGSACSVLTIWGQQLAEGGPLTVTDPRMTRYFMTIPEAATLVIQSATLTPGGEARIRGDQAGMFVLDMGEPIRILDLAFRFAREHGLTPALNTSTIPGHHPELRATVAEWLSRGDAGSGGSSDQVRASLGRTIEIAFTGTRPGEKIHEELAYSQELLEPTAHPGIRAWAGDGELGDIPLMLKEMDSIRFDDDPRRIVAALRRHVPEMTQGEVRADA